VIYSFQQSFNSATPPAIGSGSGISLNKDARINLLAVDKFGEDVVSRGQFTNLHYNVDVRSINGTAIESDYETGLRDTSYTFSFDKNTGVFAAETGFRSYQLAFELVDTSQGTLSTGVFAIYHNRAEISAINSVTDGTDQTLTGRIEINLSMSGKNYYNLSKFDIYSGDNSSFGIVTGTGGNLLKSQTIFSQSPNYTLTINEGEQPNDGSYHYYKIIPYDVFGSGVPHTAPTSGLMYQVDTPAFSVNTITGSQVVLLNNGMYSVQGISSGVMSGIWTKLDIVPNISGNISSLGYYNTVAEGDFVQNETYLFKTLKYTVQTTDASGNVSSREILVTDNTTSDGSVTNTGIVFSEYAASDRNESALFTIYSSGVGTGSLEDYQSGSGYIYLYGRSLNAPSTFKLYKTWL